MNVKNGSASLSLLLLTTAWLEAQAPPLVRRSTAHIPPSDPDPAVLREVAVDVIIPVAREAPRVTLPLFDRDRSLELMRSSPPVEDNGSVIWAGRVEGQEASTAIFSTRGDVLVANIVTQPSKERRAEHFEIRFVGPGHVFREIDPSKARPEGNAVPSGTLTERQAPTCSTDPATEVDILVVFTPKARKKANGPAAMRELVKLYVEETNLANGQSQVPMRLRLVGAEEVAYQESGHPATDLSKLKRPGGALAEVDGLRDAVGADVVALIVEYTEAETDSTSCGNAFLMETVSNAFESSAFAVVPRRCADRWMSFTHELGHVMGARHDWVDDASAASPRKPFRFSHGFVHLAKTRETRPAFRTLMAKDDECLLDEQPCDRVLFWSNPDVGFPPSGVRMGVADGPEPSNNAETLRKTAPVVANFRCRKTNVTPP